MFPFLIPTQAVVLLPLRLPRLRFACIVACSTCVSPNTYVSLHTCGGEGNQTNPKEDSNTSRNIFWVHTHVSPRSAPRQDQLQLKWRQGRRGRGVRWALRAPAIVAAARRHLPRTGWRHHLRRRTSAARCAWSCWFAAWTTPGSA